MYVQAPVQANWLQGKRAKTFGGEAWLACETLSTVVYIVTSGLPPTSRIRRASGSACQGESARSSASLPKATETLQDAKLGAKESS